MYSRCLVLCSLAIAFVSAQELDQSDYPASCSDTCGLVASATQNCDDQYNDDDGQYNCICGTQNMETLVPQCLSCLSPLTNVNNEDYDEGYDDVQQILQTCGFDGPTQTGSLLSCTVYTTTVTSNDDDGEIETDTDEVTSYFTGSATRGAASPTSTVVTTTAQNGQTTVVTSTSSPSPTGNDSVQSTSASSPNAAAVTDAPVLGVAADIMAVMVAL